MKILSFLLIIIGVVCLIIGFIPQASVMEGVAVEDEGGCAMSSYEEYCIDVNVRTRGRFFNATGAEISRPASLWIDWAVRYHTDTTNIQTTKGNDWMVGYDVLNIPSYVYQSYPKKSTGAGMLRIPASSWKVANARATAYPYWWAVDWWVDDYGDHKEYSDNHVSGNDFEIIYLICQVTGGECADTLGGEPIDGGDTTTHNGDDIVTHDDNNVTDDGDDGVDGDREWLSPFCLVSIFGIILILIGVKTL